MTARDSQEELIENGEIDRQLAEKLPERQREDYIAVVMDGKDRKEHARDLGVSYATVVNNIHHAKKNLRELHEQRAQWQQGRALSCSVCGAPLPEDDTVKAALWHSLQEHPEEVGELLNDNVLVKRECSECGNHHDATVQVRGEEIYVDAACPECEDENPFLIMMKSQMSPDELLESDTAVDCNGGCS